MKKEGREFSLTVWSAVALGAIGIGVIVAFLAGYFLGHFTGHDKTTTVSAVTSPAEAGGEGEEVGSEAGGEAEEAEGTEAAPIGGEGSSIFTKNCGSCHTLSAAGTEGTVGPNLDQIRPNQSTVEHQVNNGGGAMPAFGKEKLLTPKEVEEVSAYVAAEAGS